MSKTGGLYMDELEKAQALNVKLLEALKNTYHEGYEELHPDTAKLCQSAIAEAEKEMP